MNELLNNPLLKRENIYKAINDVEVGPMLFRGMEILPMATVDDDEIVIDVQKLAGGMTQAVARGAESPIVTRKGRIQRRFSPAFFREKYIFTSDEINRVRKLGTTGERERATDMVADMAAILRERVEVRIEWSRWEAMTGSLSIDENDIKFTVDYNFPASHTPVLTGTDRWTDVSNSDPIDDIMDWKFIFRGTGIRPKKLWFNSNVENLLFKNERIRDLIKDVFNGTTMVTRRILQNFFTAHIGDVVYEVYDEGYYVAEDLTVAASAGADVLNVGAATNYVAGEGITITSNDGETTETNTIAWVDLTNNTIGLDSVTTNAFPLGSQVLMWKPFIADNAVIYEGMLPPGSLGGQDIGEFISTEAEYGAGTLMDPRPGIFAETQVRENIDPKEAAVIGGVYGLPVLYRNNAIIYAQVY